MGPVSEAGGLPAHIAIIMDGNGRWAKQRLLPRSAGHAAGSRVFKTISQYASDIGVRYCTFYVFSTENWSRPKEEVEQLLRLFSEFFARDLKELSEGNVRIRFIGDCSAFPENIRVMMEDIEKICASKTEMTLNLAMNYGGKAELARAARLAAADAAAGRIVPEDIDEAKFSDYLYTAGQPDVDLLIRTGGDLRISNYLLWQIAYAEMYVTKKYWPDFTPADLDAAIEEYRRRDRRYGGVKE